MTKFDFHPSSRRSCSDQRMRLHHIDDRPASRLISDNSWGGQSGSCPRGRRAEGPVPWPEGITNELQYILPLSWKECTSNYLGESNFSYFEQILPWEYRCTNPMLKADIKEGLLMHTNRQINSYQQMLYHWDCFLYVLKLVGLFYCWFIDIYCPVEKKIYIVTWMWNLSLLLNCWCYTKDRHIFLTESLSQTAMQHIFS
jgi:hypothetical protein